MGKYVLGGTGVKPSVCIGLMVQADDNEQFASVPNGDYGVIIEGIGGWERFKEFIELNVRNGDIIIHMPDSDKWAFWLRCPKK